MKQPEYQPSYEREEQPGLLLFSYLGALFRENNFKIGPVTPSHDVINLDSLQLQRRYNGIGMRQAVDRQVLLELYGEQIAQRHQLPVGTVSSNPVQSKVAPNSSMLGKPPLMELTYHETEDRRALNQRLTVLLKHIPDTSGILGVETFSLHIRAADEFGVSAPLSRRAELVVDHKYHLPNECKLYDLPHTTAGDRPTPQYPFLGPQAQEPTRAFWEREPLTDSWHATDILQKISEMLIND